MKVAQAAVVSLLKELDMVTADKWPIDRLEKKIASLPKLVKQEELEAKTKEGKKLLASILKALAAEEDVKVGSGVVSPAAKPAKAEKSSKPSKKPAKDEDEGDEEEEAEESDEEESDEDAEESDEEESEDEESDDDADGDEESESDDEEEAEESDDEEEAEDDDEKPAKKPAKKGKGSPIKSAGGDGKPGIIASIIEFLTDASEEAPVSKKGLLKKLVKRFPERAEASMKNTVNVQVPYFLRTTKQIELGKNDKGYWMKGKIKAKKSKG